MRSLLWPSLKTVSLLLILNECAKFLGSCAIVGLEGLVPVCHRAFVGILWVHIFFANVFSESKICSRGYFMGPEFFLVSISWVQKLSFQAIRGSKIFFSRVFHQSKILSRGCLESEIVYHVYFVCPTLFLVSISCVRNFFFWVILWFKGFEFKA